MRMGENAEYSEGTGRKAEDKPHEAIDLLSG